MYIALSLVKSLTRWFSFTPSVQIRCNFTEKYELAKILHYKIMNYKAFWDKTKHKQGISGKLYFMIHHSSSWMRAISQPAVKSYPPISCHAPNAATVPKYCHIPAKQSFYGHITHEPIIPSSQKLSQHKKVTIHFVTTMLATSENVLFLGHNHLLTTGTDDQTFWSLPFDYHRVIDNSVGQAILVVSRWLWPGNKKFLEMACMVVTWWIVAFLCSAL